MIATSKGDMEVIQLLLDKEADADLKDVDSDTAAIFARQYRQSAVVELLEKTKTPDDHP